MTKLWEADHPYNCNEGNYYKPGQHYTWESWADFYAEYGDSDPDYNLVFRWDWPREWSDETLDHTDRPGPELAIYMMGQRKARSFSHGIAVRPEDEPAVRAWLAERWKTMLAMWAPICEPPA